MTWAETVEALEGLSGQVRAGSVPGWQGSTIIDAAYSAAAASTIAALELPAEMPGSKVAVLGDRLDLGPYAEEDT